jgi:hypothetical protein
MGRNMAEKPLLFVDVDGVVCVFGPEHVLIANGCTEVQAGRITQWVAPDITAKLVKLTEHFTCVWATAWFRGARDELAPSIGVGTDWAVLDWGDMKLPAIMEMAGGQRWAFIDDDIEFELRHLKGTVDDGALLLPISPSTGLTDAHVAQLIAFANSPE